MITAEETHQKFHQLTQGRWQQERRFFFFRNPSTNSIRLSAGYEMKQPTTETLFRPFQHNVRNSTSLLWKLTTYSTMASNEEYVDSHFDIFPSTATSDLSPLLSLPSLSLGHQDSTIKMAHCGLGPVWESFKPSPVLSGQILNVHSLILITRF